MAYRILESYACQSLNEYNEGYMRITRTVWVSLECDTEADLPSTITFSVDTGETRGSVTLAIGSKAHCIGTDKNYMMQSDGTWQLQGGSDLESIITAISELQSDVYYMGIDVNSNTSQITDYILPALKQLINEGAKNRIPLLPSMTTDTNGVTFTVNTDGTITLTGTATATAFFAAPITLKKGLYLFSGMPDDTGGSSTYRLEIRDTPQGTVRYTNTSTASTIVNLSSDYSGYFTIRVASGYNTSGAVVSPMIALEKYIAVTPDFVPYAPTLRELYLSQ